MVKVTREKVIPVPTPDVVITLDDATAKELVKWLAAVDTPALMSYLWDALDDVVNLECAESIKGIR